MFNVGGHNMSRFYMHVEAVNLARFVDDTHDISTIRGGSFTLLKSIEELSERFRGRLQPISTAASQGLFFFDGEAEDTAYRERLRVEVLEFLHKQTDGHATFVAAIAEEGNDDFPFILEKLTAQIRRQQWRMPTIAVPRPSRTDQECFLDGWRPGTVPYGVDPDVPDAKISQATSFRRRRGRVLKHSLFAELLGDSKYEDNLCARDLGELAADSTKGVLDGRIAFIHVDGNFFGGNRRDLCTTPDTRRLFDAAIQDGLRKPFLKTLLHQANNDVGYQTRDAEGNQALRIEVLLWGGDEMTLVVPAWKGWEVLSLFYEQARDFAFDGVPLSHRAVVIFCKHNAPILQIRKLAASLLDHTKQDILSRLEQTMSQEAKPEIPEGKDHEKLLTRLSSHRYGDALHYLVLESFDMLQGSLRSFLTRYYTRTPYDRLLIFAHQMEEIRDHLNTIRAHVARSKVFEVIEAVQQEDYSRIEAITTQMCGLLARDARSDVQVAIEALTSENPAYWHVVGDLWNYIPVWET